MGTRMQETTIGSARSTLRALLSALLIAAPGVAMGQDSPDAGAQYPLTVVFHIIAPTAATEIQQGFKRFTASNNADVTVQVSSAGTDRLATYAQRPVGFSQYLVENLRRTLPAKQGWPSIEMGVCVYRNRPAWQRIADAQTAPADTTTSVLKVAEQVNIGGQRTMNVIVAPLVLAADTKTGTATPNPLAASTFEPDPAAPAEGVLVSSHLFSRALAGFDEGKFLIHELGHWLGLDQSAAPDPGSLDNYMNAIADSARAEFSPKQIATMKRNLAARTSVAPSLACRADGVSYFQLAAAPMAPTNLTVE